LFVEQSVAVTGAMSNPNEDILHLGRGGRSIGRIITRRRREPIAWRHLRGQGRGCESLGAIC
jgi:hypothetical protein